MTNNTYDSRSRGAGRRPVIARVAAAAIASATLLSACASGDSSSPSNSSAASAAAANLSVAEQLMDAYPDGIIDIQSFECAPRNENEWYRTGKTLAIDPTDPDTMYVSVEWKGVFKSVDGGQTWQPKSKGILAYARADDESKRCFSEYPTIKINPVDSQHVLLIASGGGGGFLSLTENNSQTGGIYQSFDGGENWVMSTADDMNLYSSDATFSPDGQTIYYATASNPASWGGSDQTKLYVKNGLVLKSTDKGETWTELPTGIGELANVINIHVDPKDPNSMVAATFSAARKSEDGTGTGIATGKMVTENQLGVLRTIDGGKTWIASDSSKLYAMTSGAASKNVFAHQFYVPFTDPSVSPHSLYSVDGGVSLEKTARIEVVAYDPYDQTGNRMLGTTATLMGPPQDNLHLWQSTDAGKSWKPYGTLPSEISDPNNRKTRISAIQWHPTEPGTIYLNGANGYVWKSIDSAKTWTTLLSVDTLPAD